MTRVTNVLKIIGIYVLLGVLLALFIFFYHEDLGRKKAIESQQRAVATVTSLYGTTPPEFSSTYYDLVYEYYDENGTRYSGTMELGTTDRDYAESFYGTEVEIYIDGNGHCIRVSEAPSFDVNRMKYLCYVMVVIIAIYTVIWVNLAIRHHL
ncbi:MAG: hypothetical protein K2M95_00745 [Clostridiales bacterium]|nr:hypothetical protein [Clostridiales bacterium]